LERHAGLRRLLDQSGGTIGVPPPHLSTTVQPYALGEWTKYSRPVSQNQIDRVYLKLFTTHCRTDRAFPLGPSSGMWRHPTEMSQAIRHLEFPFYRLSSYPNWTPTATANLTSLRIQVDAKMMDTWVALGSPSMENYLTSLVSFPFVVTALTRQTFTSTLFNNENRSFWCLLTGAKFHHSVASFDPRQAKQSGIYHHQFNSGDFHGGCLRLIN